MAAREHAAALAGRVTELAERNGPVLRTAAELVFQTASSGGLVLVAGAGHSLAAVAETFYRAGGLACVRPLYHPELLPMHGARSSTAAERRSGLAAEVLAGCPLGRHDLLVVFSTSGVNPYPVELAGLARDAGRPVLAFTSPASAAAAPRRAPHTLVQHATVVLDTGVPPGDASYPPDSPTTAAVSTVANAVLWNLLLVELWDMAAAAGVTLPLWRSANVPGGDEANAEHLAGYGPRVPELG